MKKLGDSIPVHHDVIVRSAEDIGAGIALAGSNVTVFHQRKLACASTDLYGEAVNPRKPNRCTEVCAFCCGCGQQKRGQGRPNDRECGDSKTDGDDAAIQWGLLGTLCTNHHAVCICGFGRPAALPILAITTDMAAFCALHSIPIRSAHSAARFVQRISSEVLRKYLRNLLQHTQVFGYRLLLKDMRIQPGSRRRTPRADVQEAKTNRPGSPATA
jgi:hypothetical protein